MSNIVLKERLYVHLRQRACDVLARQLESVGGDIHRHVRDIVRNAQSSFQQNDCLLSCASTQLNEAQWRGSVDASCSDDRFRVARQDGSLCAGGVVFEEFRNALEKT